MNPLHLLEFVLFSLLGGMVRMLPFHWVHPTGAALGTFAYHVLGYRRGVTRQNLRHAFPLAEDRDLERIAGASFRTVAGTLLEFMWTPNHSPESLTRTVHIENPEVLQEAHRRGKGVIILSLHFGCWEYLGLATGLAVRRPLYVIVKTQSNRLVDSEVNRWRTWFGNKTIRMGITIREVLRALQEGEYVAMAADQTAPKESVAVEFFGRPVPTFEGPAALCLKTGAPIIFGCAVRKEDGAYGVRYEEVPHADVEGTGPTAIREVTLRHVRAAEKIIRTYPEQWMWMHKRWKHVPAETSDDR